MSHKKVVFFLMCLFFLYACSVGVSEDTAAIAQAHYKMGVSYLSEDKLQFAFVEFQKAIKLDPMQKDFQNAMGIVFLKLNYIDKAETAFLKATILDTEYSEGHNNLCFLYYSEKQWETAAKSCRRALENLFYRTPEKAYYNLGRTYYRLGKHEEAIASFEDALKRHPGISLVYYGLALAQKAQGDFGKAAEAMENGLLNDTRFDADPDKAEVVFLRAMEKAVGEERKDFEDMVEILRY